MPDVFLRVFLHPGKCWRKQHETCTFPGLLCRSLWVPLLAQKKAVEKTLTDQQFVDFAAQTDMVEANLGQLTQSAGETQSVKDYGQMLVTDHTKDYGDLLAAAHQANLTVLTTIDAEHNKQTIDPLQKLKGAAFEHKYAHDMVEGHTKAIAVYQKEATAAESPVIQSYAQAALPVLQKHLPGARGLEKGK